MFKFLEAHISLAWKDIVLKDGLDNLRQPIFKAFLAVHGNYC